jgi:hypothetical protein
MQGELGNDLMAKETLRARDATIGKVCDGVSASLALARVERPHQDLDRFRQPMHRRRYGLVLCRHRHHIWGWEENLILACTLAWWKKATDIVPLIYESCKRKNWKVAHALDGDAWIDKIDLQQAFTMQHFLQLVELWTQISNIQLHPDMNDDIT